MNNLNMVGTQPSTEQQQTMAFVQREKKDKKGTGEKSAHFLLNSWHKTEKNGLKQASLDNTGASGSGCLRNEK